MATTTLSGMPTSALGFSVSTWIKLDNSGTQIRHVYHDDTRSGVEGGIWFHNLELYFRAVNSGGAYGRKWAITYSDFLSWTHIAVAWDGDMNNGNVINRMQIYIVVFPYKKPLRIIIPTLEFCSIVL